MATQILKSSKAAPAKKTSAKRTGVKDGMTVSVAGGAMRIASSTTKAKSSAAGSWSPLSDIVRKIKANPTLGERAATKAGITTPSGQLTKTYKR